MVNVFSVPHVYGDGVRDDTDGIQAALDSGAGTVYLPSPDKNYLISRPLVVNSGQTLLADRQAVIRLADQANCVMLTNSEYEAGNQGITIVGGIWDGNNAGQTRGDFKTGQYSDDRFVGVTIRFRNVRDLTIRSLTVKDPESFAFQLGELDRFTIEDITFDFNLLRPNMDGVHCHGPCSNGWIRNLKGTTNDDLVALNADDAGACEMTRGPIYNMSVDGVFSEDCWTAVRLLSAGSPVSRVRLSNIFGTYRYNLVSFTHHNVHPGEPTTFEDIVIDGVFASKSVMGIKSEDRPIWTGFAPIWIVPDAVVKGLTISDYSRTESKLPIDDILVEPGATVDYLALSNVSSINQTPEPYSLVRNMGEIKSLNATNIRVKAEGGEPRGCVIRNEGAIGEMNLSNVATENLALRDEP